MILLPASFPLLLALAGPAAQLSEGSCRLVTNGDFDKGLAGWSVASSEGGFGDHATFTGADVIDVTGVGGDGLAGCLQISAGATWDPDHPTGSAAQAQVTLARDAIVRGRFLELAVHGEFEPLFFGGLELQLDARVVVHGPGGLRAETVIYNDQFDAELACGPGIVGLGILSGVHRVDLYARGLRLGDAVRVEVTWGAVAVALNECDDGFAFGTLCVDDVAFCGAHLAPAPGPPRVVRDGLAVRTRAEAGLLRATLGAHLPLRLARGR